MRRTIRRSSITIALIPLQTSPAVHRAIVAEQAHRWRRDRVDSAGEWQQDLRHLAWQLKNFSRFLFDYGDWRRMREVFARADAMTQEADRYYGEIWQSLDMPIHRGMYALAEGREEVGRWLLEEVIERVAHTVPSSVLLDPTCQLAEADLLAGDAEQARQRIATFLHDPRPESPEWYKNEPLLLLLTWAEAILGEEALAEARLEKLLADASPLFRVDVLRIQGVLAILRRRWEVGVAALQEAVERAHAMPFPYAELKARWVYGQLEAARGDPAAARKQFTLALAICDRLGEGLYRTYIERDLRRLTHKL
jgi:tetratricopeptide (TPR) repeat protein